MEGELSCGIGHGGAKRSRGEEVGEGIKEGEGGEVEETGVKEGRGVERRQVVCAGQFLSSIWLG